MQRLASIVLGLSLVACGASGSSTITRAEYDDTAQTIANATANSGNRGDVASMSDSVDIALGTPPLGMTLSGTGSYTGSDLGLDFSLMLSCIDASGSLLDACGPTTNTASVEVAWSGMLDTPNLAASVRRSGTWTITDLQTDTAKFTGYGSFSFDTKLTSIFHPSDTATYAFKADAAYDGVGMAMADHQIVGGSASFDVTARHMTTGSTMVDSTFQVTADIAFQADHTASITLDGDQHYLLSLTTGVVVRVN